MMIDPSTILVERYDAVESGPSFAVKDCIDIRGRRTSCGSRALADGPVADGHAQVVQALVDAGWALAGKAAMHELAFGMTGINGWTGIVPNPLHPGLMPGGSSSGSAAAVAAGLVDLAIGSDTGGSVRMPAACCGVIGFKPSFGRLSRAGVHPAETTLDCVGLFANSMALIESAMMVMDPTFVPVAIPANLQVAVVATQSDGDIAEAVAHAVAASGSRQMSIELPLLCDAFEAGVVLMAAEASMAYGHLVETGLLGDDVEERLRAAPTVGAPHKVEWAHQVRDAFTAAVDEALQDCDVLAMPTLPGFPPALNALGDSAAVLALSGLVRPFNLSGHPAISLPLAAPAGRPRAIQLVARRGADPQLCAAARTFAPTY